VGGKYRAEDRRESCGRALERLEKEVVIVCWFSVRPVVVQTKNGNSPAREYPTPVNNNVGDVGVRNTRDRFSSGTVAYLGFRLSGRGDIY